MNKLYDEYFKHLTKEELMELHLQYEINYDKFAYKK